MRSLFKPTSDMATVKTEQTVEQTNHHYVEFEAALKKVYGRAKQPEQLDAPKPIDVEVVPPPCLGN